MEITNTVASRDAMESIVRSPWEFACNWYGVDEIHRSITRSRLLRSIGDLPPVPTDVYSREFAEWLADQYRLAMRKGAELAIREMQESMTDHYQCAVCKRWRHVEDMLRPHGNTEDLCCDEGCCEAWNDRAV